MLDCQATGNNPEKGHLLEIGWAKAGALEKKFPSVPAIQSFLIDMPGKDQIPSQVKRITGISEEDLAAAHDPATVWKKLVHTALEIASTNPGDFCPTIIHFSRFEEPFLRHLHQQNDPQRAFPFDIICTLEIARRLLPHLPRKGLRAIAGYFGHSVPQLRRCSAHVAATAVIWRNMVRLLEAVENVRTLDELCTWLTQTNAASKPARMYPMDEQIRLALPDRPGVYRMLRSNGDLLYIGKARSLKRRVNSYFQKRSSHAEHILEMLTQARDLDVTATDSALEAALMESDEIKIYSPPYNIALRKGDRRLGFYSKDFRQCAPAADDLHCVGPLPCSELLKPIATLAALFEDGLQGTCPAEASAILGFSPDPAPDMDCLRSGIDTLRRRHADQFDHKPFFRALTHIGARLWRERLQMLECAEAKTDTLSGDEKNETEKPASLDLQIWTPELIADAVESLIRRGAHLIRRARWFCLLSESSLAWESRNPPGAPKHLLVFENGAVNGCIRLRTEQEIPWLSGYKRSLRVRQRNFDLMRYDRLRIVTTELRRLVSEGREVMLRVGPQSILGPADLQRALRWV
jgi:DNA polymerase-3 subunit epsilon